LVTISRSSFSAREGEQIRVGITAPKETPVHRDEVYQKIKDEEPV
jgi:carbon storage regulator CsrA